MNNKTINRNRFDEYDNLKVGFKNQTFKEEKNLMMRRQDKSKLFQLSAEQCLN